MLAVIVKNSRNIRMTIEDIRNICISLPHATEDIKYGTDLCFSLGNKIFCGTRIEGPFRTGIKCNESDFSNLIERQGIVPMPRLSTTYWIRIEKDNALSAFEWKHYIKKSFDLIMAGLPKKIKHSFTQSHGK
jgi:predicted DNA-binding protein (MmcQ/YjbR family)